MNDIQITQENDVITFVNNSEYILLISIKPIKPKRKYTPVALVNPKSIIIWDYKIDITMLSFSLEKICDM